MYELTNYTHLIGYVRPSMCKINESPNKPLIHFSIKFLLSKCFTKSVILLNGSRNRFTSHHTCFLEKISNIFLLRNENALHG